MTYRDHLPARLAPNGEPIFPLAFHDRPRAAVAREGQDPQGLGAQHDRASRQGAPTLLGRIIATVEAGFRRNA